MKKIIYKSFLKISYIKKKCPRAYRPTSASNFNICQPCNNDLNLYDYMYLGFMLNASLVLHFLFIDDSVRIINKKTENSTKLKNLILYLFSFLECLIAFILTVLLFSAKDQPFRMKTCSVESINDWYTIFFNPYIDYYTKLNCSQEVNKYVYYLFIFLYNKIFLFFL